MQPLNCLIVDIPQAVLVDILQRIAEGAGGLNVIEGVADSADLPTILSSQTVNVLIIGMEEFVLPKIYNDMLNRYSDLLIVGLVNDGRMAAVFINDIRSHEFLKIIEMLGRR
ncbi:MAG: hypothetical protein ACC663_10960 [Gammaproteobacteria bacterium]